MGAFKDLTGRVFGRLTVQSRSDLAGKVAWLCVCSCGGKKHLITGALTNSRDGTKSCGCLQKEAMKKIRTTHGKSKTYLHRTWASMIQRCTKQSNPAYPRYGARGISVDPQWACSFENFQRDVGPRPSSSHTLDRIDNDDGYHKNNVQWATKKQQARNRSSSRMIEISGVSKTLAEWSDLTGVKRTTIAARIDLQKLSPEQAIA